MVKWHYTTERNWKSILESREIRPATLYVPKNERPVVWFSIHPYWEPTATKGFIDKAIGVRRDATIKEMIEDSGLVRISVADETAVLTWEDVKRQSGMDARTARGLYKAAIVMGARTSQWFASFDPIPFEKWTTVEEMTRDEKWVPKSLTGG